MTEANARSAAGQDGGPAVAGHELVEGRLRTLLAARPVGFGAAAVRAEVEEAIADGAALILALERERLAVRRRLQIALVSSTSENETAEHVEQADARGANLVAHIDAVRGLLAGVRHAYSPPPAA